MLLAGWLLCLADTAVQSAQQKRCAMKEVEARRFAQASRRQRSNLWRQAGVARHAGAEGVSCGLHRIERLMRHLQALKARPRRRRLPPDLGERQVAAVAQASTCSTAASRRPLPTCKWIADFTYACGQRRVGSMWLPSSICSPGAWSAGR